MTDNNLIPFSKELWESGEYEAVTRNNETAIIYQINEGRTYGRLYNHATTWLHDGSNTSKLEWKIMLRKKTKKMITPLYHNNWRTIQECELACSSNYNFIKAIEVEI